MRVAAILAALVLVTVALGAAAQPAPDPLAVTEDRTPLRVDIAGHTYALDAIVVRQPGTGKLPVALITHGASPGNPRGLDIGSVSGWAHDLAQRGWLAVGVMRRGYGHSEGDVADDAGSCASPDVGRYLEAHADDLVAALQAVAQRPDADMSRVLAIGDSAGGAAVMALAARMPGSVTAVVNVSGGLTHDPPFRPDPACDAYTSDLVWNFARFGVTAHMPTLWLYAENDGLFRPGLVGRMRAAFTGSGGKADVVMLPPFGADGHALFFTFKGRQLLLPELDRFLRANALPTWDETAADPLLAKLSPPDRQVAEFYLDALPAEKALALGPAGGVYWRAGQGTVDDARTGVLAYCHQETGADCRLAAEDFHPVPQPAPAP